MRTTGTQTLLYASGSGVYGDIGSVEAHEDYSPLIPASTYGASKLAGEALIASYCAMFGLTGRAFRFGNVVGPRQTHGVGFDFVRRLLADPTTLRILGNGTQSKSYVHIFDIVEAVLTAYQKESKPFEVYNVATGDYITVKEIADLALECLDLDPKQVSYQFTGGDRGWKGDVPIVRLNTDRIQRLGWKCKRTSREALKLAMMALIPDAREGRL
jgi:UDP-glucose 4-epimerase